MTARLLFSPLLAAHGIPHCFSTRVGGVSAGPFESLNLGNPSELRPEERDAPEHIRENFRRILVEMGCEGRALTEIHQVHGGAVHIVPNPPAGEPRPAPGPDPRADAVITDDPVRVLAVRVADCAPVLLATPDGSLVAAVHAGWRGVIAGVAGNTVAAMRVLGAREFLAAIGPCIGPEHFEVGPEVLAEFRRTFPGAERAVIRDAPGGKGFVDLKEALRRRLAGVGVERCDVLPHCTFRDADLFFSHRRDRGITGRTAGLIGPRRA